MKRKIVSGIMLTLMLISISTLAFDIQPVKASGTICIRADGSIDPPTAPISTVDNVTYTLTGNISDSISIGRNNIVVDGAGYTVQRTVGVRGIDLTERSNVTIKNMEIKAFQHGIWLEGSSNNTISRNNITNNYVAIRLENSPSNRISENNIGVSDYGGIWLGYSSNNTISGNNIASNNYGAITIRYASSNNTISRNNITNTYGYGIEFYGSSSNFVYHNNFVNNMGQVYTENSVNVWDDGYPCGGNYWSDYTGADADCDGIGDTPYVIDANNEDRYPLIHPWSSLPVHNINTGLGYATIQEAINAPETLDGQTIFVDSGVYNGLVWVNKSVTIVGENAETTVIDGEGTADYLFHITSSNAVIENFTLKRTNPDPNSNSYAIQIYSSNNVTVKNAIITDVFIGVFVHNSNFTTIAYNRIYESISWGIRFIGSCNNTLVGNTFERNPTAISFADTESIFSRVYHNSFINNTNDVWLMRVNYFDDGYPSGGNYWSDYSSVDLYRGFYQNETGSDGIGDTSYAIVANIEDHYPLMKPYGGTVDIGIADLTTSKTVVGQGYNLNVTVKVINYGINTETFNLTVYANTTIIATFTNITLTSRNSTTITFTWNTTDFVKGNYTISTNITQVLGETDTTDNMLIDSVVLVGVQCDVTGPEPGVPDDVCNMRDIGYFCQAFITQDPNCDVTGPIPQVPDGTVNMRDIGEACNNFMKT